MILQWMLRSLRQCTLIYKVMICFVHKLNLQSTLNFPCLEDIVEYRGADVKHSRKLNHYFNNCAHITKSCGALLRGNITAHMSQ